MGRLQFDVKFRPQNESGEYKVETRDGKKVRVLCYDANNTMPVVALVTFDNGIEGPLGYYSNGTMISDRESPLDLFLITPEPELSEFEKGCIRLYQEGRDDGFAGDNLSDEILKESSAELLELARKEIMDGWNCGLRDTQDLSGKAYNDGYQLGFERGKAEALKEIEQDPESSYAFKRGFEYGKEEAMKDLPRWREWGNGAAGNSDGHPIALVSGAGGIRFVSVLSITGEKYIMLDDLKKLPGFKED